jgi:hypothetical protein
VVCSTPSLTFTTAGFYYQHHGHAAEQPLVAGSQEEQEEWVAGLWDYLRETDPWFDKNIANSETVEVDSVANYHDVVAKVNSSKQEYVQYR